MRTIVGASVSRRRRNATSFAGMRARRSEPELVVGSTESKALRKSQELPKRLEESSAVSSNAVMSCSVLVVVLLLRVKPD